MKEISLKGAIFTLLAMTKTSMEMAAWAVFTSLGPQKY